VDTLAQALSKHDYSRSQILVLCAFYDVDASEKINIQKFTRATLLNVVKEPLIDIAESEAFALQMNDLSLSTTQTSSSSSQVPMNKPMAVNQLDLSQE
jgi:hypothetical protein